MKRFLSLMIIFAIILLFKRCSPDPESSAPKKLIILAGEKSHPATMHEYIKNARLIKVMLDGAISKDKLLTEIHYNGWPLDEEAFEGADLVLTISDGRDGPNGLGVPFMTEERMQVFRELKEQGCNFMTFHYSTFAPDKYGEDILEWTGGYFDWQNEQGEREWYSDIKFLDVEVELPDVDHPVLNGVDPFKIYEEYYFDMRFRKDDTRLTSIVNVPELGSDRKWGNVVAWVINRNDGGRGFGTTLGHLYANWKDDNYRKLLLNAITWTCGLEVPAKGIEVPFYSHREVHQRLYGRKFHGLLLTGNDHPAHDWEKNSAALKVALEKNGEVHVDVSTNINDLYQYDLRDYDFLAFNYANWEDPDPLWDGSKRALVDYVDDGGSLMFIHFANGAFHFSLPGAEASDWPEFRRFCRRVWDHTAGSAHDQHGSFQVQVTDTVHQLTDGIQSFEITDELYYNQAGNDPVNVLLTARSKDTGKEEPLAWVYELDSPTGEKSRVFQTVLGHDSVSFSAMEFQEILSRSAIWLSNGTQRWNDL